MRVRDPTRKSLLEFRGPVFPIDVTGHEVSFKLIMPVLPIDVTGSGQEV